MYFGLRYIIVTVEHNSSYILASEKKIKLFIDLLTWYV